MRNTQYQDKGFGKPSDFMKGGEESLIGGKMGQLISNQYEKDFWTMRKRWIIAIRISFKGNSRE